MKIAIVVLSYFDNDIYSELYRIQNETWNSIHVENVDTYFLIGNSEKNEITGNLIKTTIPESVMCAKKTLEGFELLKDYNYDFIFRTNSSSYIDKSRLKQYVITNCDENSYRGIVGNHLGILYASGSGYLISKKILETITINSYMWDLTGHLDDVGLGDFLQKLHIHPKVGFRQDIITDGQEIDINQYHYRLKCGCTNRIEIEKKWFQSIHELKLNHQLL